MPTLILTVSRTFALNRSDYQENATPAEIIAMAYEEYKADPYLVEETLAVVTSSVTGTIVLQDGTQESIALGSA